MHVADFAGKRFAPSARTWGVVQRIGRTERPLAGLTAALFVILAACAIERAAGWTYGADTGTFVQLILDVPRGMHDALEGGTHFRYHDSPTLVLLWPLLALVPHALTLQLVQIVATLSTGPLLAMLIRPYTGAALAARLGILAVLYPPLLSLGFNEFHEVGILSPLVVAFVLAADRRAWGWFAVCTVLLLGIREDVCLEVAIAGITFALVGSPAGKSRALALAGGIAAVAGLAVDAVYYGIVTPALGGWAPSHFYVYPFASGPLALLLAPFTHPLALAVAILTLGRLTYLLEAFAPLAFLPLRSRWSLLAIPGFAIVLLANTGLVWRMGMHYSALWIPWLLIGTAFGVHRIAQRSERMAARWLTIAIGISVVVLVAFNPMHPAHYLTPNYHALGDARRALACVPTGAPFSTHDEWYSAVAAERPEANVGMTDGIAYLVYADDFDNAGFVAHTVPLLHANVVDGRYRIVCTFGAVHTYERVAATSARADTRRSQPRHRRGTGSAASVDARWNRRATSSS
jgi:uncharacterized membrane protein